MNKPHGDILVNNIVSFEKYRDIFEYEKKDGSTLNLNNEQIKDLKNIARGVYSPLKGFIKEKDYKGVLSNMKLENGIVWPIPIVLDISKDHVKKIKGKDRVFLLDINDNPVGIIRDIEIFNYDKNELAKKVFGTNEKKHPGVNDVYGMKDYLIGGEVEIFEKAENLFPEYNFTPKQMRRIFQGRGWNKVVAFQTRNIPHRGHEYLQTYALKNVDGLLIQPVIGEKKNNDFKDEYILGCYEILIDKYLPKNKAILSILPLKMRYAGPKEAVFHALIRKNYGCTHFIVGRDHAGVGDYYHPFAAQKIFKDFKKEEIDIDILKFEEVVYDKRNKKHCFVSKCGENDKISFSGSEVRNKIKEKKQIASYLIRPEIYDFLSNGKNTLVDDMYKKINRNKGFVLWLTGLSQSGKSSLADEVYNILLKKGHRVERLDGDIVRESLTRDLGFSKEDRDENIRRVGFLAKLLSRNGVGVIASFISPYKIQRDELKRKVENYIEVFVDTPLGVCEKRDKKGLYKKAREGKIKNFTGISDPYEEPNNPDLKINTVDYKMSENVEKIIKYLEKNQYI